MQPGKDAVMNTIATQLDGLQVSELRSLAILSPPQPIDSVYKSFAYRSRVWWTAASLTIGCVLTAWNSPLPKLPGYWELAITLTGVALFCAGAAIRVISASYICARKSLDVVNTGPYSVCRNPLYWGTLLMVSAFPFLMRSPVLALSMVPIILLYTYAVVPVEEMVMANRHGEKYMMYCNTVPRWLPNFQGYVSGEAMGRQTEGFYKECKRLVYWVALAVGLYVAFRFHDASWWLHPLAWW